MKLEILMAAMHQTDLSLVEQANIKGPVVIVNQADREDYIEEGLARMFTNQERGVSRSRSLALAQAREAIGLLADYDSVFVDDVDDLVLSAYERLPQADIIIFDVQVLASDKRGFDTAALRKHSGKLGTQERQLSYLDTLKVSEWQISFRVDKVREAGLSFDEKIGTGSGNGGGEGNKFLWDALKKGLTIYYVPNTIATMAHDESTWFHGFDAQYFYDRGRTTRYSFGLPFAVVYAIYFVLKKHPLYRDNLSLWAATKNLFRGLFTKNQL